MRGRVQRDDERGTALLIVLILMVIMMGFTALSVDMTIQRSTQRQMTAEQLAASQIAESGVAQALVRMREAGILQPMSGGGSVPVWVKFGTGGFLYRSAFDAQNQVSTIRAWGRVPVAASPSASTVAPDELGWDGKGWLLDGYEVTVVNEKYMPQSPCYFGNGAIERPVGGFEWTAYTDIADPSTWSKVPAGSQASFQTAAVPFELSALNYPANYLYAAPGSVTPEAPSAFPHPYTLWSAQNGVGLFNVEAWFKNSAGAGVDPLSKVTPTVSQWYQVSDPEAAGYPFVVDTKAPDVQTFAEEIWNDFNDSPSATKLTGKTLSGSGSAYAGTYGDFNNPRVTIVTGRLHVASGTSFKGAGILLIRDNYDSSVPNSSNQPQLAADLLVDGVFEWTGLVLVAGWCPSITSSAGSSTKIVGALFGEDSVMSGGETSLDAATIAFKISGPFKVLWSKGLFEPTGMLGPFLPFVRKEIVGFRLID